jgi:hypothetical protein
VGYIPLLAATKKRPLFHQIRTYRLFDICEWIMGMEDMDEMDALLDGWMLKQVCESILP